MFSVYLKAILGVLPTEQSALSHLLARELLADLLTAKFEVETFPGHTCEQPPASTSGISLRATKARVRYLRTVRHPPAGDIARMVRGDLPCRANICMLPQNKGDTAGC